MHPIASKDRVWRPGNRLLLRLARCDGAPFQPTPQDAAGRACYSKLCAGELHLGDSRLTLSQSAVLLPLPAAAAPAAPSVTGSSSRAKNFELPKLGDSPCSSLQITSRQPAAQVHGRNACHKSTQGAPPHAHLMVNPGPASCCSSLLPSLPRSSPASTSSVCPGAGGPPLLSLVQVLTPPSSMFMSRLPPCWLCWADSCPTASEGCAEQRRRR